MQEIASGVFIETAYEGVNVAAILTDEGIIAIDAPSYPRDAHDWVSRISRLHGRGVRYLLLTGYHGDRILNTRWFGVPIIASQATAERLDDYDRRYPQSLLEGLSLRNPQLGRELTSGPVDRVAISFTGHISLHSGRGLVNLVSRPGPNAGSAWVLWPEAGILFSGDSVVAGAQPPLSGLLLAQWLAGLKELNNDKRKPRLIVPGRGEPGGPELATSMITYLHHISAVVEQHIAAGGTRQELAGRAREILDYFATPEFGAEWYQREVILGLQRAYDQLVTTAGLPLVE
ncbi:MAG: MBL fold metallo-hydrolase [Chloroflexota bacterium]|jgi:glyoxylase-like metal-dependent hydrolase (beta-lactamase superfamily II)